MQNPKLEYIIKEKKALYKYLLNKCLSLIIFSVRLDLILVDASACTQLRMCV